MVVGAITVGQAPRPDMTDEIQAILGKDVTILEGGALDNMTKEDVDAFLPKENEPKLVSFLKDGTQVIFAEHHIYPYLQKRIDELEAAGAQMIMMYCCGEFPDSLHSNVPLVYPRRVLEGAVSALAKGKKVTVLAVPDLLEEWTEIWNTCRPGTTVIPSTPYGEPAWADLEKAAKYINEHETDLVVLDCMSFTGEMKDRLYELTHKNILCSRIILAHTVAALL